MIFYSGFTHLAHEAVNSLFGFDTLFLKCFFRIQNVTSTKVAILRRLFLNRKVYKTAWHLVKQNIVINAHFNLDLYSDHYYLAILTRNLSYVPPNSVSLFSHYLNIESFVHICDVLKTAQALYRIAVHHSKLSVIGLQFIALALQLNTSLSGLLLRCISFTKEQQCDVQMAFTKALHQNTTLRTVHFSFCSNFDIAGLLSEGLRRNCGLKKLVLKHCNITSGGVAMLAKTLEHHCTLFELYIASNPIGNDGAIAIAGMLSVNDTLLTLDIADCSISDVGLEAISTALVVNTTLGELNISCNLITDRELIMLGHKMQNNTTLETLHMKDLEHSPISKFCTLS